MLLDNVTPTTPAKTTLSIKTVRTSVGPNDPPGCVEDPAAMASCSVVATAQLAVTRC